MNHAHQRPTRRLWTLSVAVLLCTGCHHFQPTVSVPAHPVSVPFGAGYCETNWAPLMTVESVETVIESEVILDEVPDARVIEVPTPSTSQFDGRARRPYQPLRQRADVPQELADQIEQNFELALQHDTPARDARQEFDVPEVSQVLHVSQGTEEPRLLRGHPAVHVSSPARSLSQLIQSTEMPVQQVSHSQDKENCAKAPTVRPANHVETILELLHDESRHPEAADGIR